MISSLRQPKQNTAKNTGKNSQVKEIHTQALRYTRIYAAKHIHTRISDRAAVGAASQWWKHVRDLMVINIPDSVVI